MKIITWNTNGVRATAKQGNLTPLFTQYQPDIVCLQETKATLDQLSDDIKNIDGYHSYFTWPEFKKGYSGVAIYSKVLPMAVTFGINNPLFDTEGRTVTAEYEKFFLVGCYFPNGGGGPERLAYKLAFYDQFLVYTQQLEQKKPVIFCGDVNTAHTAIDLARPKENVENTGFLPIERAWIDAVIAAGYTDAFRVTHPDTKDVYTYWDQKTRARERNVGWRIDYFFISQALTKDLSKQDNHPSKSAMSVETLASYQGSDHCPVLLDIAI